VRRQGSGPNVILFLKGSLMAYAVRTRRWLSTNRGVTMRKIIELMVVLVAFLCAMNMTVLGQLSGACQQILQLSSRDCLYVMNWNDLPTPSPTPLVACDEYAPFSGEYFTKKYTCGPPPSACPSCSKAGQPIDLATGNTDITESDVSLPGLGGGLRLSRIWNSLLPAIQQSFAPMFGTNWLSTYEERLVFNSSDMYLKYARSDGSVWSFGLLTVGNPNVYRAAAPANDTTTTIAETQNGNAVSWTINFKSGEIRAFDPTSGALLSITDRNGNTTQLAYDASNRLISVTDAASRHLYFNYTGSSTLVSTVTSDVGITLSYSYDGQGRLTQFTKPDSTTVSFAYDTGSHITTVTDNNGKVLESHTYDVLGRGLTSSRANGVEAVTVTYPQ
jgi:YD repeat-containing protein